jgi:propionyl-CoA carboxylase alpha chain
MIRVAAGEKLALTQADVKLKGWAVESRVYAEDPTRNFLPSTGRLVKYRPPEESSKDGVTVRNDTGVFEGGEISIHYDPMIAKLCTHAPTRVMAIAAMSDALDSFVISGIRHNIPFLSAIMADQRWKDGKLSAGFIAETWPSGFHGVEADAAQLQQLAKVAALLDHMDNSRKRKISGQMNGRQVSFSKQRQVSLGGNWHAVEIDESYEREAEACGWKTSDSLINAFGNTVQVRRMANGYVLSHRGVSLEALVYTKREAELARLMPEKKVADTSKALLCPMPGLVISIAVGQGQDVKAGDVLAVVEAMKMQNVLRAERDLTVKKINVAQGDSLGVDAVMMEFS